MVTQQELREVFPNPAVREVSCEIRFAPRLRILPEVWRIQEKLAETHPQIGEEKIAQGDGRVLQTYVFANQAAKNVIKVSQENFVVSTNRYSTFEQFQANAISYISEFAHQFDIRVFQRIGLRYVNHIELPSKDGIRTLQRYLKAPIDFSRINIDDVEQFLMEFRLRTREHKLTVRGALLQLPSRQSNEVSSGEGNLLYILDLDAFDFEQRGTETLEPLLDDFHESIQVQFLEHLTDEYKKIMRGAA